MYPRALVRTVNLGLALSQHDFMLVGTIRTLATHGQLEALWHTTGRTHNPIPAVALIELWTLAGTILRAVTVEHDDGLTYWARTVSRQLANGQYGGKLRA